jgi:hypothetical protein
MPPKIYSRHEFTGSILDSADRRLLTDRVPYRYANRIDDTAHVVSAGESLFSIAGRYFGSISDRGAGLWWIIADYQPDPILDPTLRLQEGSTLFIPSTRTVLDEILNPKRRVFF